jgi:Domain of unknown function (DUF1906)
MRRRTASVLVITCLLSAAVAGFAPAGSADPGTAVAFPAGAVSTRFNGGAFDACTAPPQSAMKAWRASPYRAVGIYIGGPNRSCAQPNLTSSWVTGVTALGWKLMPIYMGLQPQCSDRVKSVKIDPAKAATQGAASARDAIKALTALGLQPGSIVYADIEHYDPVDTSCRTAVLTYVSGFTRQLHQRGYLAGVYANLSSGVQHFAAAYRSTGSARPDALWAARWDGSPVLTGLTGVTDDLWSRYQRAKQYRGPHFETYGGVKLHVDSSWVTAPVATVLRTYRVIRPATARSGPSSTASSLGRVPTGSLARVVCQAQGAAQNGTTVWNKLTNGSYVSDYSLGTPTNARKVSPIPPCYYAYQVVSADGLSARTGPGVAFGRDGQLNDGALAWITCQAPGSQVGPSAIWNQIDTGKFVSDYYVTTPSRTTYSTPVPRCASVPALATGADSGARPVTTPART